MLRKIPTAATLLGLLCAATVLAQNPREETGLPSVLRPIHTSMKGAVRHSGGWGWSTPAIVVGGQVALAAMDPDGGDLEEAGRLLTRPRFWGGVAGSLVGAPVALALARRVPGPPILKTAVALAGGFIGWELGSLNLPDADWLSISGQIVAAAGAYRLAQHLTGAKGLMSGDWRATAAAIGGAVLAGVALDLLRRKSLDPPLTQRRKLPTTPGARDAAREVAAAETRLDLVEASAPSLAPGPALFDGPLPGHLPGEPLELDELEDEDELTADVTLAN